MHDDPDGGRSLSRRRVLGGVGGAAGTVVAGCLNTGGADDGDDGEGPSLTYAQPRSFVDLDPVVLNDVPSAEVAGQIFEGLYEYDTDLDVVPRLAAEAPTVERGGRRWTVPLNPDATFQNGEPVTATDVAYSYTAPLSEGTDNAGEVDMIETVDPVDEHTVRFDLAFEFGAFRHYLNRAVVPKAVREADRQAFNTDNPVGSGPFTFERGTQGENAVLTRWEDYWSEPTPNLAEITVVPVPEATSRITTLETGESDVVRGIQPTAWETVRDMADARIEAVLGVSYVYVGFNCNEGPTADPQVREAIDYAVSMDRAVERFVEPAGRRVHAPIPRQLADRWEFPVESWRSMGHDRDVDRAKALLDDAAVVPDDWSATILVPPDDTREDVAVSVANGIRETGYDATVRRLDLPTFRNRYNTGSADDYNLYALGWLGAPDPDTFMYFLFAHETIGSTNGSYYRDEGLNRTILAARRSTDHAERWAHYTDAVETVLTQRVHLPAYTTKNSFGVRERVRDWLPHPIEQFDLVSAENNVTIQ